MIKLLRALVLAALFGAAPALAQSPPIGLTPTFSSFGLVGRMTDISVTTSSQNPAIGMSAPVAVVYNIGASYAYVRPSSSSSTSVTVSTGIPVPPGTCAFVNTAGASYLAAIGSGATTLQVALGYGIPGSCGGAGGGGGGGGGNVNLYQINGAAPSATNPLWMSPATGAVYPVSQSGSWTVSCSNCSGGGGTADEATFTPGTSTLSPAGGFYQTTVTNNPLTNLQTGMQQLTQYRAGMVNLRQSTGAEIGVSANPLQVTASNASFGISGTLPAFAATPTFNCGTGCYQATQPVSASSLPLPTGAASSANQSTEITSLAAIQSSVANIPPLGQALAAASVPVVLTAAQLTTLTPLSTVAATQSGTWNVTNISGTISLPTGAATSANQTGGGQKTQIVDGSGNVIGSTSNALNIDCVAGCLNADGAVFSAGSNPFSSAGGVYQSAATANPITTGHIGLFQMTTYRAQHMNLRDSSGNEEGLAANPLQVSLANTAANATALSVTATNTSFAATQATAANLNATVVGTGTFSVQVSSSALPTGAATSANQPTNAAQASTTSGQTGHLMLGAATTSAPSYTTGQTDPLSLDLAGNLRINCVTGCAGGSGGTSATDEATFTYGTTSYTPIGGVYNSSITALSSGQGGALALTSDRNAFVNLNKVANTALGAPSAYGTSPGAVNVIGVNAFVTNSVTVAQATAASLNATVVGTGTFAVQAAQSGTWNITNISGTISLPTGASTSANQATAAAQASTTSGQTGTMVMGAVTTAAPSYTTAQTDPLSLTTAGSLRTDNSTVNGIAVSTGAGAVGTGTERVAIGQDTTTIAGSAPGTAGTASANVVSVQGIASMTPVQVSQATAANLNATVTINQGGSALSATNGVYANVLQGNAALSVSNPSFTEITDGTNGAVSVKPASTAAVATDKSLVVQLNPDSPGIVTLGTAGSAATNVMTIQGIASMTPVAGNITQVLGAAISATNGLYTNVLQGNAALSATNPIFSSVTDGTNKAAVKAASTAPAATDPALVVTESPNSPLAPFSAYATASITRSANTTTYTANTGWNNGTPTFFSFTVACRVNGGQVLIPRIDIWSSANPTLKLTGVLWLFSAVPGTNVSDDATFTIASADFANLTGNFSGFPFTLSNNQASGASNSSTTLSGVTYQAQCASGTTTITGMVEVTNAYVPASAEVLHIGLATSGLN